MLTQCLEIELEEKREVKFTRQLFGLSLESFKELDGCFRA